MLQIIYKEINIMLNSKGHVVEYYKSDYDISNNLKDISISRYKEMLLS
jgi:hypothetical protein